MVICLHWYLPRSFELFVFILREQNTHTHICIYAGRSLLHKMSSTRADSPHRALLGDSSKFALSSHSAIFF